MTPEEKEKIKEEFIKWLPVGINEAINTRNGDLDVASWWLNKIDEILRKKLHEK